MKDTHALAPVRAQHHLSREEDDNGREQERVFVKSIKHVSVMLTEALEQLEIKDGELVLDATAGSGGHSEAVLAAGGRLLAIDADPTAVERTRARVLQYGARAEVVVANFKDLESVLKHAGIHTIDKALFDLGWNKEQLGAGKGFSFLIDEPLNMSYGVKPASGFTAAEIVNGWSEEVLADVLYGYGEETYARRIAKAIVDRRAVQPIKKTLELSEIIKDAVPAAYRRGRLHPATRSFQALRMAVNAELASIEAGLGAAWKHVRVGGRIAVITFHSIEDRAVKRLFLSLAKEGGRLVVKKPLVPSRGEVRDNPSARSAKLRVIEKTPQNNI
ncbi:MAG TPA: 16S rRNA (cytosine(1402)-N(4))-methyltransferase RsmH [Candidatus Paceibacterota bacterium]